MSLNSCELSLVIPSSLNDRPIEALLDSILIQNLNSNAFEVIVVINGEGIWNEQRIQKLENQYSNVRFLINSFPGTNRARNVGAKYAQGDFLFFIDDDCRLVDPSQLKRVLSFCQERTVVYATGMYRTPINGKWHQQIYNFISNSWLRAYSDRTGQHFTFLGGALLISRHLLSECGGFDESIQGGGEEWSLAKKLLPRRITFLNSLCVWHSFQGGWWRLLKKKHEHAESSLKLEMAPTFDRRFFALAEELSASPSSNLLKTSIYIILVLVGGLAQLFSTAKMKRNA
ncbi:MAG: glycosyltransferase family A protein [Bdellovibrionales bacterium]